jgi:glycosyltransferase involved in cell wall biosynthesis
VRALFLLTYYTPHWTGLTAYAKRIAEGLAARGHEVSALATQHDPSLAKVEVVNGVTVHRVTPNTTVSRSAIAFGLLPKLNQLLAQTDVVSIHIPFPEVLPATALARSRGRAVFLTHNGDLVLPKGPAKRPLEALYYRTTYLAGRLASGVIPQTRDYAASSALLSPLKDKLHFIYAPVDLPFPDASQVASWRAELGLTGKTVVGFAGRFVEEKGFDFLLQAVPEIVAAMPDAQFVFAGEYAIPYERFYESNQHLLETYADRFKLLGLITDPQKMANFYGMLDLFALPSRSDCFPSTQLEAVRSGTPLVTADIPGAREIVRVTGMGRIVAAGDPHALAQGIIEVATNRAVYAARHAKALEIFDPDRCFAAYETLFENAIAGRPLTDTASLTEPSEEFP